MYLKNILKFLNCKIMQMIMIRNYLLFLFQIARFLPKLFYDPGEFWYRDRVINIINSNNVHFVDFYNEIKKSGNPKKFYPFGLKIHFTPDGYKKLSQFVINEIN